MKEIDLQNALILNPGLIEGGLIFKKREVFLDGKRCDLLFVDKDGKDVYVEVKLKVTDRAAGQLMRYASLVNDSTARYMLVGLSIVDGLKEALAHSGFEYTEIDEREVSSLISRLKLVTPRAVKEGHDVPHDDINDIYLLVLKNKEQIELLQHRETVEDEMFKFLLTENTRFRERVKQLE